MIAHAVMTRVRGTKRVIEFRSTVGAAFIKHAGIILRRQRKPNPISRTRNNNRDRLSDARKLCTYPLESSVRKMSTLFRGAKLAGA